MSDDDDDIVFDYQELQRIFASVKRDGDALLSDDDRRVYEQWREFAKKWVGNTREVAWVHDIFEELPKGVQRQLGDWTLQQTAAMWPLIREDLIRQGIDVEAAERRAKEGG